MRKLIWKLMFYDEIVKRTNGSACINLITFYFLYGFSLLEIYSSIMT